MERLHRGVFTTAQQFGGAVGIAIVGTVFTRLENSSFTNAFALALPIAAGMFVLAAALALLLPPTAVSGDEARA